VIIGGLLMAAGHFMMAFESLFFIAMVVIALGNGLFLPNLPSQVPLLYPKGDPRAARRSMSTTWASTSAPSSRR
jgi:POT family proton-dependent oligopeptide transporter